MGPGAVLDACLLRSHAGDGTLHGANAETASIGRPTRQTRVGDDVRMARTARLVAVGAALVAVAGLLGGCGGQQSAKPVPAVTLEPLAVSMFAVKPCDLLRDDPATRRHLAVPGTVTAGSDGPVCRWTPTRPRVPLYTAAAAPHIGLNDVSGHREDYSVFRADQHRALPGGAHQRPGRRVGSAVLDPGRRRRRQSGDRHRRRQRPRRPVLAGHLLRGRILATEILGQMLSDTG